ncbi:Hypothetical protein D9617_4g003340 [Elsinoe fawcettii]|nr:Hypothetical protein D9617_4g003340 [Elsinoe fawcettii]
MSDAKDSQSTIARFLPLTLLVLARLTSASPTPMLYPDAGATQSISGTYDSSKSDSYTNSGSSSNTGSVTISGSGPAGGNVAFNDLMGTPGLEGVVPKPEDAVKVADTAPATPVAASDPLKSINETAGTASLSAHKAENKATSESGASNSSASSTLSATNTESGKPSVLNQGAAVAFPGADSKNATNTTTADAKGAAGGNVAAGVLNMSHETNRDNSATNSSSSATSNSASVKATNNSGNGNLTIAGEKAHPANGTHVNLASTASSGSVNTNGTNSTIAGHGAATKLSLDKPGTNTTNGTDAPFAVSGIQNKAALNGTVGPFANSTKLSLNANSTTLGDNSTSSSWKEKVKLQGAAEEPSEPYVDSKGQWHASGSSSQSSQSSQSSSSNENEQTKMTYNSSGDNKSPNTETAAAQPDPSKPAGQPDSDRHGGHDHQPWSGADEPEGWKPSEHKGPNADGKDHESRPQGGDQNSPDEKKPQLGPDLMAYLRPILMKALEDWQTQGGAPAPDQSPANPAEKKPEDDEGPAKAAMKMMGLGGGDEDNESDGGAGGLLGGIFGRRN